MQNPTRKRGPKGQFVKATNKGRHKASTTGRHMAAIILAVSAAIGMALLLGRAHFTWSQEHTFPSLLLPQDLYLPFD